MMTVMEAYLSMKPRPGDAESARLLTDPVAKQKIAGQIERWPSFALPHPDRATVICGLAIADDIGEAWLVPGDGFESTVKTVRRQIKRLLQSAIDVFGLKQLMVLVDPDRRGAVRYVEKFGFKRFPEDPAEGGRFMVEGDKAVDMYFLNLTRRK